MGSPREAGTRFSRNSERQVGAKARSLEPRPPGSSDESRTPHIGPRPAASEVFEKISAPGARASRHAEPLHWLPGLMSQSAVVRDYRALETGRRRAKRLVLTARSDAGASPPTSSPARGTCPAS